MIHTSSAVPDHYRADIDGLRGIAVGCVVAFHYFPHVVRGGFIGVDVFFVISGYLIAGLILAQLHSGTFVGIDFYSRRIRRIFPCLLLVLLFTCTLGWYLLFPREFGSLIRHVLSGATFSTNFVLWREAGYFDPAGDTKPLLHLWSLAIEEQFYIVFPGWLILAQRMRWRSFPAIAVTAVLSFALCMLQCRENPIAAFYSPMSRIWEILCGVALAYTVDTDSCLTARSVGSNRKREYWESIWHSRYRRDVMSVLGLSGIMFSCSVLNKATSFPGLPALLPVGGAIFLIGAGRDAIVNRYILNRRLLVALGLISYPLYMWHWPILVFARIAIGDLILPPLRLGLIGLALGFAIVTYVLVEKPVRRSRGGKWVFPLFAGCVCVGVGSTVSMTFHYQPRAKGSGLEEILNAALDWGFPPPAFKMLLSGGHRFWRQDSQIRQTTIFVGDSNVEQYAPRISELLLNRPTHYRSVIFATTGGCSPIPAFFVRTPGDCRERMTRAFLLADAPDVDTVVLGALWTRHIDTPEYRADLDSFERLVKELSAKKTVFVILNMPTGPELDPQNMFTGSRLTSIRAVAKTSVQFDIQKFLHEYGSLRAELKERSSRAGATVIDPLASLCTTSGCPIFDTHGRPLYRDASHMRPFYVNESAWFIDQTVELRSAVRGAENK